MTFFGLLCIWMNEIFLNCILAIVSHAFHSKMRGDRAPQRKDVFNFV